MKISILLLLFISMVQIPDSLALMAVTKAGETEIVKALLDQGASPNYEYEGAPIFTAAMQYNHIKIAQLLLDRGADINSYNCFHETALHFACTDSYHKVKFLLNNGAQVNPRRYGLETPLHKTALGCPDTKPHEFGNIVKELINHDADIFIKDGEGNTPAHTIMFVCGKLSARRAVAAINDHGIDHTQWLNNKKHAAQLFLYYACLKAPLSEILSKNNGEGKTPVQMVKDHDDLRKFLEECEQKKPQALEELMNVGNKEVINDTFKQKRTIASLKNREIAGKRI